ncbi:MAG: glycosyltransferase [Peptococcaceae bacterium]|nr:glycosyltransferase [Peptococcaceae bacterium]
MSLQIVFTRSTPIMPDPRIERAAICLRNAGYNCLALGWARERSEKHPSSPDVIEVKRFYFPGKFGGGFANALGLLVFNAWLLCLHLRDRPRVIHAVDLDTVLPALIARFILGNRVIYDIADWYADSRKVGRLKAFFDRIERWVCHKADHVILAHEGRLRQTGPGLYNYSVIYNTPDDIAGRNPAGTMPEEGYFAYVGVLQEDRGIPEIIEAGKLAGVRVILAGFGPLADYCSRHAQMSEKIIFRGRVSYEEALYIQQRSVGILALYDPTLPNNRLAAPNKLYEAMMLGRPIITSSDTLAADLVEREKIGRTVLYGDVRGLADAMKSIAADTYEQSLMCQRARALYEKKYSFSEQCRRLTEIYEEVMS